jgi:hypothetical protein
MFDVMTTHLSHYLERVTSSLMLDSSSQKEIVCELRAHLEDRVEELKGAGFSDEEAAETAIRSFVPSKVIARQMYQIHSLFGLLLLALFSVGLLLSPALLGQKRSAGKGVPF